MVLIQWIQPELKLSIDASTTLPIRHMTPARPECTLFTQDSECFTRARKRTSLLTPNADTEQVDDILLAPRQVLPPETTNIRKHPR